MDRILVAVDFSDCSRRAFQTAVEYARRFDALIHVAYVAPEVFHHLQASETILPVHPRASRYERDLCNLVVEEFKGSADEFVRIDKRILEGIDYLELLKEIERVQPQLVIVGSHGRAPLERLFLGSVSDKIVRKSPSPVLIVPQNGDPAPRKVLVAIGSGHAEAERVLAEARDLCSALESQVTVLHVLDNLPEPAVGAALTEPDSTHQVADLQVQTEQRIDALVTKSFARSPRPKLEFTAGRPWRQICRYAETGEFDLIIVGDHDRVLHEGTGTTALRVAHRCPCSVLVLR